MTELKIYPDLPSFPISAPSILQSKFSTPSLFKSNFNENTASTSTRSPTREATLFVETLDNSSLILLNAASQSEGSNAPCLFLI